MVTWPLTLSWLAVVAVKQLLTLHTHTRRRCTRLANVLALPCSVAHRLTSDLTRVRQSVMLLCLVPVVVPVRPSRPWHPVTVPLIWWARLLSACVVLLFLSVVVLAMLLHLDNALRSPVNVGWPLP